MLSGGFGFAGRCVLIFAFGNLNYGDLRKSFHSTCTFYRLGKEI